MGEKSLTSIIATDSFVNSCISVEMISMSEIGNRSCNIAALDMFTSRRAEIMGLHINGAAVGDCLAACNGRATCGIPKCVAISDSIASVEGQTDDKMTEEPAVWLQTCRMSGR